jgi:hypothetical protein
LRLIASVGSNPTLSVSYKYSQRFCDEWVFK